MMLGWLCKWERIIQGSSLRETAEQLHLSVAHLSNIENRQRAISLEVEISLKAYYNLPANFAKQSTENQLIFLKSCLKGLFDYDEKKLQQLLNQPPKINFSEENYLSFQIISYTWQQLYRPLNKRKLIKFCIELVKDLSTSAFLKRTALYFLITENERLSEYQEACYWIERYLEIVTDEEDYTLAHLLLKRSEFNWELGKRAELLKELPSIRKYIEKDCQRTHYLMGRWDFLYGQCMLYHGLVEEASFFFEKLIIEARDNQEHFGRVIISKIILFSYTQSANIIIDEIIQAISDNKQSAYFMNQVLPHVYTFASALLTKGYEEKSKEVLTNLKFVEKKQKEEPNRLHFLILKSHYCEQYDAMIVHSEHYFKEERFLAKKPFQAIDICKLMIQYYDQTKQYKKAAHWGSRVVSVANTYFGYKSLI